MPTASGCCWHRAPTPTPTAVTRCAWPRRTARSCCFVSCSMRPRPQNARGGLPLVLAVDGGHLEAARLLLERGAAPDALSGEAMRLALRFARQDIVQLLLRHGAAPAQGPQQHPGPRAHPAALVAIRRRCRVVPTASGQSRQARWQPSAVRPRSARRAAQHAVDEPGISARSAACRRARARASTQIEHAPCSFPASQSQMQES
jgi:ankyrin repeat protein